MSNINMPDFVHAAKMLFPKESFEYIVEVGAFDGADSMFFKQEFPGAWVYAIEGNPDNFQRLSSLGEGVTSIYAVISGSNGSVVFYKKENPQISGIYNRGNQFGTETDKLLCYTLRYICREYAIPHIDMMKIDVEGATLEVLQGMGEELLRGVKIMHVETETYPFFEGQHLADEVYSFLTVHGFVEHRRECAQIENGLQCDSVWYNPNKLPQ